MAITDWPAEERPREKLMQKGVSALSDAELLAIFCVWVSLAKARWIWRVIYCAISAVLMRFLRPTQSKFLRCMAWGQVNIANCKPSLK